MKIYKKQETENVVYFIKSNRGFIKIGTTIHFNKRKRALETQNCEIFNEYFMVEGSYDLESYFHKKYSKQRIIGEWFNLNYDKLYKEIKNENKIINYGKDSNSSNLKIDLTIEYTFADIISNYLFSLEFILNNEKYLKTNFTGSIKDFIKEYKIECENIVDSIELNESIEEFKGYNSLYDYIEKYILPCNVDYITNKFFSDFINDKIDLQDLCYYFLEHLKEISNLFNSRIKKNNFTWIDSEKMFQELENKIYGYIEMRKNI